MRSVVATLATAGTCLFNLATPRLLGRAVDQALLPARGGLDAPLHAITITALMLLGVSALRGGLQMAASYQR